MILTIQNPPTLHRPDKTERERLLAVIQAQLGAPLARRLYRISFDLYGNWFKPDGTPREANTDNVVKSLLDLIAEAGGLGKRGRGDCWLDRRIEHVWAHQSDLCYAVISLE